jgi:hypothetical protein
MAGLRKIEFDHGEFDQYIGTVSTSSRAISPVFSSALFTTTCMFGVLKVARIIGR